MPSIEMLLLLEIHYPINAPFPSLPQIPEFLLLTFSGLCQLAQKLNCTPHQPSRVRPIAACRKARYKERARRGRSSAPLTGCEASSSQGIHAKMPPTTMIFGRAKSIRSRISIAQATNRILVSVDDRRTAAEP